MSDDRARTDIEDGYEGDVSDKAGDRLGGGTDAKKADPKQDVALEDMPAAVTPEP